MATRFIPNKRLKNEIITSISRALDKSAIIYKEEAEKVTPVTSGHLKRSYDILDSEELKRRVVNNAEYAACVEFGTLHQTAQPFMRSSLASSKKKILNEFKDIL